MADDPLTRPFLAVELTDSLIQRAIIDILSQGGYSIASEREQASLLIADKVMPNWVKPLLVLGHDLSWPLHPRLFLDKLSELLSHPPIRIGVCWFDYLSQTLRDSKGQVIGLTQKESHILTYLLEAKEPVSREVLLAEIWGYDEALETHTLETHIYRIRRKLGDDGAEILITGADGYGLSLGSKD